MALFVGHGLFLIHDYKRRGFAVKSRGVCGGVAAEAR